MINPILPYDQCLINVESIKTLIEQQISQEPQMLMEYLGECSSMLSTSAQIVASMQHHFNTAKLNAVQVAKKDGYSGTMAKMYIEGYTAETGALFKFSERQNAALTHRIDSLRSILSFTKQELYHSNTQQ